MDSTLGLVDSTLGLVDSTIGLMDSTIGLMDSALGFQLAAHITRVSVPESIQNRIVKGVMIWAKVTSLVCRF